MYKQSINTFLLEWETTGVTNADISINLSNINTSFVLYDTLVAAIGGSFFYTIPEEWYDQTSSANYLQVDIYTPATLMNGDASPVIDYTTCILTYDTTGQLHIETQEYATVSANTDNIDTTNIAILDRTEYYSNGGQIFWDTSDVSGVSDVTNAEYIYSSDMRSEFCLFPEQGSGYLKVKRTPVALYEGVDGTVVLDTSVFSPFYGQYLGIYLSANDTSVGTYLGSISSIQSGSALTRTKFGVPYSLMKTMSDASFAGMTMSITNDHTTDSRWKIYDSVFEYTPTTKELLDTTHYATVADSTTPIVWTSISTTHKAKIKKGAYYVLEYYTKNDWWDFDV